MVFETSALKILKTSLPPDLTGENNTFLLFKIIWFVVLFLIDDNFLTDNISLSFDSAN